MSLISNQDYREIESLIDELAELAKSSMATRDFHRELVERTVRGLAASGGAFWSAMNGDGLELEYQTNLPEDVAEHTGHSELLAELKHDENSRSIGPRSGYWLNSDGQTVEHANSSADADQDPGRQNGRVLNPTDLILLCCPIRTDDQMIGVVEVYQRPGASPAVQAGYLRFIETIAEVAAAFHQQRLLRRVEDRADRWQAYEEFAAALHGSLDANRTAYAIASEGRRLIDCDRLSVATAVGRRCEVVAVSGVDSVNRRSNVIRAADRLATAVAATGEPQWILGGADHLPPTLQASLNEYLTESASRILGIIPLTSKPQTPAVTDPDVRLATEERGQPLGALIVECYDAARDAEVVEHRTAVVARHAELALRNVREYETLPFLPVLRGLRAVRRATLGERLSRSMMVLALLVLAVCGLVFIPADFEITGRGELQPQSRRDVFAEIDGVVDVPPVQHGKQITRDQSLLVLRNVDLEYEFSRVTGEIVSKEQARDGLLGKLLSLDLSAVDAIPTRNSLTAEKKELDAQLASLHELKAILTKQKAMLTVQSPIDGRVLTWDVEQLLLDRPVKRGQRLVTVADLNGPWVLELHVSDRDIGHVSAATLENEQPLRVEFVLATNPDVSYEGTIKSVAMTTSTDEEGESTVLVTVDIVESEIGELRPGATVIPRIDCGRRSLGYVWFHGVWDWFKTRVMF